MNPSVMKILIVEDERIIAADLEESLEEMGYQVCGTTSFGEKAVELAGTRHPDLVIMDIQLEGAMNGLEAAAAIKAKFNIPIIYLSAYSDEEVLAQAEITEPFGYLLKPFQSGELRTTIRMARYKAEMEKKLREANDELKKSLAEVKQLSGLLPICAHCKKIRDSKDYWHQVEKYIATHSEVQFSHSICPECIKDLYSDLVLKEK